MKVLAACLKFRLAVKWDTWTLNRHGLNKAARETASGPRKRDADTVKD